MTDNQSSETKNNSENISSIPGNQIAVTELRSENGQVSQELSQESTTEQTPQASPQQEAAAPPSATQIIKSLVIRAFIIYLITQFLRRPSPQVSTSNGNADLPRSGQNVFAKGTHLDLYVYINEEEFFTNYSDENSLFWVQKELVYGNWEDGPNGDGSYVKSGHFFPSENVLKNSSLYLHVIFVKSGKSPNPSDTGKYSKKYTVYKSKRLNKFKKKFYKKTQNLLTGETEQSPEAVEKATSKPVEVLSHWHPNLTINLVDDHTPWTKGHIPHPINEYVLFDVVSGNYFPMIFLNDYWNLLSEYYPINESTRVLNLTLTFKQITLMKFQFYAAQSMKSMWASYLGDGVIDENEDDQDFIKQALLDTSPYLLALTVVVAIVHSIFEFLAFKNDIQFWNNRKSLEGLSVRSVFFNVFQSLIVLLYVMDNETNTIVRISVFVGLTIEVWKIHKVVNIEIDRERKIFGILPRIWFSDKGSYAESSTKRYDLMAFKYLSWALFPLLGCYAAYSLLYLEHKGWYSWVLGMLYGFLLTFGFIMMTPQLFINYKLKSVAHLPWRMMTYKALNTFIDDVFAFVIKMPTMYRLGCLRDDIVFFIYIYQRWIYRVDPMRINEFGTSGEMENSSNVAVTNLANGNPSIESSMILDKSEQNKKDD